MKRWTSILICATLGLAFLTLLTTIMNRDALAVAFAARDKTTMTIIDLGTLGGDSSRAADLNNLGQVVGSSTLTPTARLQGFLWNADDMEALAANNLPTMAYAVNEASHVAGTAVTGPDATLDQRPVLWQDDTFVPLPLDNTLQGSARAINDQGQIAGQTLDAAANALLIWELQGDSFSLTATIPFSAGLGQVNQLNNQGQIVGHITAGDAQQAFLWDAADSFTTLETLGGTQSAAYDINELGHIAGSSMISGDLASHATLWLDGQPQDLGTYEGDSRALGLNDNDVVVGEAEVNGEPHAVLWAEGEMFDLNDFLPEESVWDVLQTAVRINNDGWIAGTGLQDGQERAFLLYVPLETYLAYLPVIAKPLPTPTPEPSPTPTPSPTPSATPPRPPGPDYDMMKYMGDGRLYELEFTGPNGTSQSRHQTQTANGRIYQTKGNEVKAEWEELWNEDGFIYRGTDTSPGEGLYYSLYEYTNQTVGTLGSSWSPRSWRVGEYYFRQPFVIFYFKANCQIARSGYLDPSWLKFERFIPSFNAPNLATPINNVVQLAWYRGSSAGPTGGPIENYYYGEGFGLVAWQSLSQNYSSIISEIHAPGTRPDNRREVIPCLQNSLLQSITPDNAELNFGPLPEPYASMVRR